MVSGWFLPACHTRYLCGIDVTSTERDAEESIVDVSLTQSEKVLLAQLGPAVRSCWVHALWACKEAYTKALGVGIVRELNQIHFEPSIHVVWADEQSMSSDAGLFRVSDSEGDQGSWCLGHGNLISGWTSPDRLCFDSFDSLLESRLLV